MFSVRHAHSSKHSLLLLHEIRLLLEYRLSLVAERMASSGPPVLVVPLVVKNGSDRKPCGPVVRVLRGALFPNKLLDVLSHEVFPRDEILSLSVVQVFVLRIRLHFPSGHGPSLDIVFREYRGRLVPPRKVVRLELRQGHGRGHRGVLFDGEILRHSNSLVVCRHRNVFRELVSRWVDVARHTLFILLGGHLEWIGTSCLSLREGKEYIS